MSLIYLLEIAAAVDAAGTLQTLRYATQGFNTQPSDTPASVHYKPRIDNAGSYKRSMYSSNKTSGASSVTYGVVELVNNDGGLDGLNDYGFDGRALKILAGDPQLGYASFTTVLAGTMEQVAVNYDIAQIILKDKQLVLDRVLCVNRYGGTNSLPAGVDGTAELKGKPKPRAYGGVGLGISPEFVNTSKLIYQVNDGAVIDVQAAYDRGSALTKGADYTSQADMEANAPAASGYRVWKAGGMFRLGSSPLGAVTCDITASSTVKSTAQVLKQIALDAGITSGEISSSDVTALDTLNNADVFEFVSGDDTALQVMDRIAASIGAWFGFDRLGSLRMGRLEIPSGTAAFTISNTNLDDGGIDRVRGQDANKGLPSYRVTLKYAKNYTVQTNDLDGAVTDARRAVISTDFQTEKAEDLTIKNKHLTSPEIIRETRLVSQSAAATEASRLLTMYKTRRDTYTMKIRLNQATLALLDIGIVVNVVVNRFGMSGGKLLRVLGIEMDLGSDTAAATLTVWG